MAVFIFAWTPWAPAIAQDKPAPSPTPLPAVDINKPSTPEYMAAEKLGRQVGPLLAEYTKSKKPSEALKKKVWDLQGKTVVVDGGVNSDGDPALLCEGGVDYLFHFDLSNERLEGLGVFGKCSGVISYVDPVNKVVILKQAVLVYLGSD
jgi:hypothetical protein